MDFPKLTETLRALPLTKRLAARRRIEMMADHWALALRHRHGNQAKAQCIRRMTYCAQHAPGMRWHIWCRVFERFR